MSGSGELARVAESIRRNPVAEGADLYHPLPFQEFADLTRLVDPAAAQKKTQRRRSPQLDVQRLVGRSALVAFEGTITPPTQPRDSE